MTQPLTFGVEFEFALAYLSNDSSPLPHPDDAKKVLRFEPIGEGWDAMRLGARRHIRKTIKEAGFPVSGEKNRKAEADVSKWEVVDDFSVQGPDGSPYSWLDVEVRTPALYFTSGSLKAVADMSALLSNTYGININLTTGLHIHVGDADRGFDLDTLSKLVSFLWAFEPQLNSLHPQERQHQSFGTSMRESSRYALKYEDKYGRRPHPLTGVVHFLKCKSITELVKQASNFKGDNSYRCYKYCQYNFRGFVDRVQGLAPSKATVEFRQHEGSMSAEAVINWIKTTVGIVDYIRKIDNSSLTDLLRTAEHETWEKLGDGKDDKREAQYGPILAESKFTIIDLLSYMKLWGPANYYRKRWRKLKKKPRLLPTPIIEWEYEKTAVPGSDDYKLLHHLREIWEGDRVAAAAQLPGGWKFDPDHPSWPVHRYLEDRWDAATDGDAGEYQEAGDDELTAAGPNQPPITPTTQARNPNFNRANEILGETEEDIEAERAELERQGKKLDELIAQEAAKQMDADDTKWRQRTRDGGRGFAGDGVIPKGSMNPFDDSQPRVRRWVGRFSAARDDGDVSPKSVPPQDEDSDGELPFLV
jgi:hypothetical protein